MRNRFDGMMTVRKRSARRRAERCRVFQSPVHQRAVQRACDSGTSQEGDDRGGYLTRIPQKDVVVGAVVPEDTYRVKSG